MMTSTGLAPVGAHSTQIAAGQNSLVQNKWYLLKTIEGIREPMGLKSTSIAILRAMLSFIKGDQVSADTADGHICFASNASLAKRSHVSIQTVERHISKLVSLGLLSRRSSSNGKRWARRDRHGSIVLATGLSLLPLAERHAEFVQISQTFEDAQYKLTLLKDKCSCALSELKSYLEPAASPHPLYSKARNILRRRKNEDALNELLEEITVEISKFTQLESEILRDTAPEIEGHKETSLNQYVKKEKPFQIEVSPEQMERAFPRLCRELKFARSDQNCARLMDELAKQLHLGDTWFAISELGPAMKFMLLGYLLERIETIKNPKGYAFSLIEKLKTNHISWETLLKRPQPRT